MDRSNSKVHSFVCVCLPGVLHHSAVVKQQEVPDLPSVFRLLYSTGVRLDAIPSVHSPVCPSVHPSVHLCVHVCVLLCMCPSSTHLSVRLSTHLCMCPSVCLYSVCSVKCSVSHNTFTALCPAYVVHVINVHTHLSFVSTSAATPQ